MKKLSEFAKWIIGGIVAFVAAVLSYIFHEKRAVNKHKKAIHFKPKSGKEKERSSTVNTRNFSREGLLSYYISNHAAEFGIIPDKRSIQSLVKASVTEDITHRCATFESCADNISESITILEKDARQQMLVCLSKNKKCCFLIILIYSDGILNVSVVPSNKKKKNAKAVLADLQNHLHKHIK